MTKLIVNADDFGYCQGVNYGIIDCHKKGIVTSTTIMTNMIGFEHAVTLLKENHTLGCGVHLTLTCHKPILNTHKTLIDKNGMFYRKHTEKTLENSDLNEVYEEFCAQIDKAKKYIDITHLDSHHHIHTLKILAPVIEKVAKKYNLPVRGKLGLIGVEQIDFLGTFYGSKVEVKWFINNMDKILSTDVIEVMVHPAYLDKYVYANTSYNINRMEEASILMDKQTKEIIFRYNLDLRSYKDYKN